MSMMNGKWINKDADNLTRSGDDLAVQFSDASAADSNKVWSSDKVNTISGVLSAEIDSDISTHESGSSHDSRYYTETELDAGQLDNRYYTETEIDLSEGVLDTKIDTTSGTLQAQIDAVGGVDNVEYITLDGTDISNEYVTLAQTPFSAADVMLDVIGGPAQIYGTDYTVTVDELGWDTLGLDGIFEAGDNIRVAYTY
jgi:hypothetical protein